jgi:polysaccharide biosynthesis PFTS motif protein
MITAHNISHIQKRGAESIFYFYSTNQDFYRGTNVIDQIPFSWRNLNWDKYLVWDKYQKEFLIRAGVDALKIAVVGCIWHIDNNLEWSIGNKKNIVVFDVTPYRTSQVFQQGADIAYLNEEVMIKFLNDISVLSKKYQVSIIYKKKRSSWRHSKKYVNILNKMASEGCITLCDTNIAPIKILENALASISIPFTSSALISKNLGVTSVYYDPVNVLKPFKHLTHDIKLISGRANLDAWFCELLSNSKL